MTLPELIVSLSMTTSRCALSWSPTLGPPRPGRSAALPRPTQEPLEPKKQYCWPQGCAHRAPKQQRRAPCCQARLSWRSLGLLLQPGQNPPGPCFLCSSCPHRALSLDFGASRNHCPSLSSCPILPAEPCLARLVLWPGWVSPLALDQNKDDQPHSSVQRGPRVQPWLCRHAPVHQSS